ncbi:ATP synthase F1 subunit delta [Sporosarcina sp. NCCP-2716]|uniref:DUF4275 family protein n=1 Tax=Sporosarcina sp. NCCP-2716 TaxID=2943679 RepID=UPI00208446F1|nr:DUF4275 family protein [Sporosarcina sp. NCCP-2716]GKV70342.1 ATP synthase F1 subunit delta [Sporosarcina sp. NCCP-2716]
MKEIPKWGTYLRGIWRDAFAGHLSAEEQKEIYLDSFLWHLCSYQQVSCLEKDEAIRAFHEQLKKKCTIFYQLTNEAFLIQNAAELTMKELPYEELSWDYGDLYVMDWESKWTFMITHEHDELGPYFMSKLPGGRKTNIIGNTHFATQGRHD